MNQRASLYVRTLSNYGSITRAAAQLYITPSALSKYVSTLEKEVGTQLFNRVGKHFVLTYAGERYLDWSMKLDAVSSQMENELRDISEQRGGKIRIGVQSATCALLVSQVVPEFHKKYPDICVSITESTSYPILEQIKHFQLDAAISTIPPDAEPFQQETLLCMDHVLLVPKEHPLAKRAVKKAGYPYSWVDLEWCRGERFVMMHPEQSPRLLAEKLLAPIWDDIQIVMEVNSMRTMIEAVINRIGIIQSGAGMDKIYSNKWKDLVKLSFGETYPPVSFSLYYHKDMYRSEAMNSFLNIVRKRFRLFEKGLL